MSPLPASPVSVPLLTLLTAGFTCVPRRLFVLGSSRLLLRFNALDAGLRGECCIPVPLPPPVSTRPTFSAGFCRAEIANTHGLRAQTSALGRAPKILSLGPFVSEPPDCADLVRNSKQLILRCVHLLGSVLFARSLGVSGAVGIEPQR